MFSQLEMNRIYKRFQPNLNSRTFQFAQIQNRRLLVVEDDVELWPLINQIGRHVDLDLVVEFVCAVDEAIDRMMDNVRYDAVLVDNCLPRPGDGETLRLPVESLQPWAGFALMSAQPLLETLDCAFLPKPFNASECGSFIGRLLR